MSELSMIDHQLILLAQFAEQRCLLANVCPVVLGQMIDNTSMQATVLSTYVVSLNPLKAPTATNMSTAAGHARAFICK